MTTKTNIPMISVSNFTNLYSKLVIQAVKNDISISKLHSVFLWGAPGVGKSQGVRELASIIEEQTGKKVEVTDIRLLLMNPVDLHGIPTANKQKTAAVWLKPKMFDMDPSEDVINLLFLDELSAAPPSVQAAAYQLVLDRKIGEHSLPDNTLVIAAGNRVTDHSVAYAMPRALANRFSHFEIQIDFDSWQDWAVSHGINPMVIMYLNYDSKKLNMEAEENDIAYPTPRTWEFVSDLLNIVDSQEDLSDYYSMIASYIGNSVACDFIIWSKNYGSLPKVDEIFKGLKVECPDSPDARYILVNSLITYVTCKQRIGIKTKELENMARFANKLPGDYTVNLYSELFKLNEVPGKLRECPSFLAWAEKYPTVYRKLAS